MDAMIIALMTDFGTDNGYAASMKGVIRSLGQQHGFQPEIIDITHEIPSFSAAAAAFTLYSCYRYFPEGTVFCAVVDPGVGASRSIAACRTERFFFLAPDNGVLSYIIRHDRIVEARQVTNSEYFLPDVSRTFHGRDIFAPCAFHTARLRSISVMGPEYRPDELMLADCPDILERLDRSTGARVLFVDKFGNIVTNIPGRFAGCFDFFWKNSIVPFHSTYEEARDGVVFFVTGSAGLLELSVKQGNASALLGLSAGSILDINPR
jgi:S-adenosyl-L-methionine hydrolase (adenosine-forming)